MRSSSAPSTAVKCRTATIDDRSTARGSTTAPATRARISAAAADARSWVRATSTTRNPRAASFSAVTRPSPRPPPVRTTVCTLRSSSDRSSGHQRCQRGVGGASAARS